MPGLRRTKDRHGRLHPKFRFWFTDWQGVRQWRTGTTNRAETLAIAQRLEDEHRQIRLGYRPPPRLSDQEHDFDEIVDEYLSWGRSHGGRGGRPWGGTHERMRTSLLAWWKDRLGLRLLRDLVGSLPRVERGLAELQSVGRAGKTLQNYADSLVSLCHWCVSRGYLAESPLKGLVKFDATSKTTRRAVTPDEIRSLLAICSPDRLDTYEVALASGLRAGELRALRVKHLNVPRCGLYLEAAWTKNRKPGFQPLPAALVARLSEASADKALDDALLYVPSHPARELDKDLEAAAIPKWTPEGKVDFHALRVAYTTLLLEAGANVKEAQVLVRHSTPGLTMDKYARARMDRLYKLVETSAAMFAPAPERGDQAERRA